MNRYINVVWLMMMATAHAASFDCTKSSTAIEKNICLSPVLSKLDNELAEAFQKAETTSSNVGSLIHQQREWLVKTRNVCGDNKCLEAAYLSRLSQISPNWHKLTSQRSLENIESNLKHPIDCELPSRQGEWVNAGNGGEWEKRGALNSNQRGYFRFIYYRKWMSGHPRIFVEAWQHMENGGDLFVGCIEAVDTEISEAHELGSFSFAPADADSVFLNMTLYVGDGLDVKSIPHKVRMPYSFIDNIY